jgi:hypothetical protein
MEKVTSILKMNVGLDHGMHDIKKNHANFCGIAEEIFYIYIA